MTPIFRNVGIEIHGEGEATIYSHTKQIYLRIGDWKLMAVVTPFDESNFGLYNLRDDPGETIDLSGGHPEKRRG